MELLEAHRNDGEGGILAYLKRKRAERETEPKADR